MREIKLRAWLIEEKKLEDVDILHFDSELISVADPTYGKYFLPDEYVLEQYTGLKDAENVDIYEGDVLETYNGSRVYVSFEEGLFIIYFSNTAVSLVDYLIDGVISAKVIGNVHQNPELLEG